MSVLDEAIERYETRIYEYCEIIAVLQARIGTMRRVQARLKEEEKREDVP